MPKITVSCQSSAAPEQTFKKIQERLPIDPDLTKLGGEMTFHFDPHQLSVAAKGARFNAQMQVRPHTSGSQVAIQVEIPLVLMPLKTRIHSTLEKKFKEYFAS